MAKKAKPRLSQKAGKRHAVPLAPDDQQRLDVALHALQQGASGQAKPLLAQVHQRIPDHPLTNYLLGMIAAGEERNEDAERHLLKATRHSPNNPAFHFALGDLLARQERFDEAATGFRQALRLDNHMVDAYAALGLVLYKAGQYREATQPFAEAIRQAPQVARHYMNAAANAIALNDATTALALLDQAQEAAGQTGPADLADLGRLFTKLYRPVKALAAYDAALARMPDDADILVSKGAALAAIHDVEACVATFEHVAQLRGEPDSAADLIACALGSAGLVVEALRHYQQAEALAPDDFDVRSHQLLLKNYLADISEETLFDAHKSAGDCLRFDPMPARTPDCDGQRPLRVGYVSADFRQHSVAYFVEPVLSNHDQERFEIYAYYNGKDQDVVSRRLRRACTVWREIEALSDDEAAALIRADEIDILVDLSGHTSGHRLPVFARGPAPVQVSWLGYPNTTGLRQIDYRITDDTTDPVGVTDQWHTEKLVRLPEVFSCYQPPKAAPRVAEPPALRNGYVTFGSFNNANKLNEQILRLWAEVLRQVPDSRLLLKDSAFQNEAMRRRVLALYDAEGIPADRLTLLGRDSDAGMHLARYAEMDIALDPYPYCGTTTTCEALWMGVPVVTLAGQGHRARVGASQLGALGMSALVAEDPQQYVAIAARLATDLDALAAQRAGLRSRFSASPLMDHTGFTRQLEQAYRDMWDAWCSGHPPVNPAS